MAGQGQINQTTKDQNGLSSLMNLMNMYSKVSGTENGQAGTQSAGAPDGFNSMNPSQSQMPGIETPQIGDSAMSRRADANNNHPDAIIAQGLKHADDPNLPLDYETRMAVIEPLLRSQHFGYGGGYEKGSQGKIGSGEEQSSDGAGKIGQIASLIALA